MAVVLIFTTGEETIEFPLLNKTVVGRSSSCDLTLPDKQMSGKHGSFELNAQGQLLYTDLDSTNGSFLNNSKIHKTVVKVNETLKLGNTTVIIDDKKLNSREMISIGRAPLAEGKAGLAVEDAGKSNPVVRVPTPNALPKEVTKEVAKEKKSIVLNKNLKSKKTSTAANWVGGKNENVLEQEESSGTTKMLKLDIGSISGKKKK